jgi:hypothetical protein
MPYQPVFPAALQPVASALLSVLAATEFSPSIHSFTVLVQGEPLSAPGRVYYRPHELRSAIAGSSGDGRTLALCLGTRHHDGYIREECLRQLVGSDRPWALPFLVQLLGEYVVEIAEVVAAALPAVDPVQLAEFARENPAFMDLTRQRVRSYWDCYYRRRFPTLQGYPAFKALEAIER